MPVVPPGRDAEARKHAARDDGRETLMRLARTNLAKFR
jgi:hypothetical protein